MRSISAVMAPVVKPRSAYVPISSAFALVARPMLAGGATSRDLDVGGRLELQLRSPVFNDLLRVYLGVGPQGFYEIRGEEAHSHDISGGWAAGVEVFLNQHFAVHWDMGTSGGDVTSGAGRFRSAFARIRETGVVDVQPRRLSGWSRGL